MKLFYTRETSVLVLILVVLNVKGQTISLEPLDSAKVRENEELNLTCSSTIINGVHNFIDVEGSKKLATAGGGFKRCLNESSTIRISCIFEDPWKFTLTLIEPVHNQTICCSSIITGTTQLLEKCTTIFVQVPISKVSLKPVSLDGVKEGLPYTFCCFTNGGRPEAQITWHFNNNDFQGNSLSLIANGTLIVVNSSFTQSFNKDDKGKKMYCSAVNIEGDTEIKSNYIDINVLYAPSSSPKLENLTSVAVDEGEIIKLECTLPTAGNPAVNWTWICGDDILTSSAINIDSHSTLTFKADKKYHQRECQCWATSLIFSYNRTSAFQSLTVYYIPTNPPTLKNLSSLAVDEGGKIKLQCYLPPGTSNPAMNWHWMCGNDTLTSATNGDMKSDLIINAERMYNQKKCWCWATTPRITLSYNKTSDMKLIIVFYAPHFPPMLKNLTSVAVDEGQMIKLQCSLSTAGNPAVSWNWVCGDNNLTSSVVNEELQSILMFQANRKYNKKKCWCLAVSPRQSLIYNSSSKEINITVYFAVRIENVLFTEGANNMSAGSPLTIVVTIQGNPASTVVWKIKYSNKTIQREESVYTTSEFRREHASCLDTNDYTVTADNGKGNKESKDISLNVLCSPFISIVGDSAPVVVGDEKEFIIRRHYIANPEPKVLWEKISQLENSTLRNESQRVTILNSAKGKVNYTTTLEMKNITNNDVGLYHLYLENVLGNAVSIAEVIFKRRPDAPSNISVSCNEPHKAKISWVAEFDGGGNQSFLIAYNQRGWMYTKISPISVSGRRGENKIIIIDDLKPNTEHEFKVYAINTYGNVSSTSVYCTVIEAKMEDSVLLISTTVALSSLVIIIIIVIAIYWNRKNVFVHNKGNILSARSENDLVEKEEADDDGMRDNILYVSAGPKVDEKPEAAVYAAVNKKAPESNNANIYAEVNKSGHIIAEGALYSDVKPKRGLFKKDVSGKKDGNPKLKKGKKQKSKQNVADVYENSEDIAMSSKSGNVYSNTRQKVQNKEERGYKNKDGLLYVEVQFDAKTEKGNQTIHGEDEKTDYATVEFPMAASTHDESGNDKL